VSHPAAGRLLAQAWPLGLITLVFNLGGGLIAPAVPLYARSLGADYQDLGLIGAAHGLAFAALTIPLGRASDRFGRRALLVASALAVGGAAGWYLLATSVLGLAAGKLLEAAGWAAFWPALEAWVAEGFGRRAGAVMGVGYAAYAAAFVVGSSAGGFLIDAAGLRVPFAVYLGTSAATVLLVLALTGRGGDARRAPAPDTPPDAAGGPATPADEVDPPGARRQRLLAYGTGFVYVFGLGVVLTFLPAYASDRGLSARGVGLLLGAYWVARVAGSLGIGRVALRVGRRAVLTGALAAGAVAAVLIALPAGTTLLLLGAAGLGLTAGICAPTCVGHIADHVRHADRGIAMGLFEAACGVSMLLGGLLGGRAAQTLGPAAPYLMFAVLAAGWSLVVARRLARDPA
jgi:MFS family permease